MKEFRVVEKSVSMNRQVCGGKKFMLDAIMNGQPGKLSENGRDVVSFLAFCTVCKHLICIWGKLAVPLEDRQREYGKVTRSTSPQRSMYTGQPSFPPSCTVQRPGFSKGSRSGYWSGFTNAACVPSLASNGKTMCRTKKSSRGPACPA